MEKINLTRACYNFQYICPNTVAHSYLQKMVIGIKGGIDENTTLIGQFNTQITSMDRSSRHKINKATHILNDTTEKLDFIDIFQDITSKKIGIHILLKCTWNIHKDQSNIWIQN